MKKVFGTAVLGSSGSRSSTRLGRPTIQTIGSYGKPKRRPGYLSAINPLETRTGENEDIENGDIESGNIGMTDRQGSGHSGETTLRDENGHIPMVQPSYTR